MKKSHIPFKTGSLAGKTHEQILKEAAKADSKSKKLKDPFTEGEKKYGSKHKMYKESMKELHRLTSKKKK